LNFLATIFAVAGSQSRPSIAPSLTG
jgi:hypothetical protein